MQASVGLAGSRALAMDDGNVYYIVQSMAHWQDR